MADDDVKQNYTWDVNPEAPWWQKGLSILANLGVAAMTKGQHTFSGMNSELQDAMQKRQLQEEKIRNLKSLRQPMFPTVNIPGQEAQPEKSELMPVQPTVDPGLLGARETPKITPAKAAIPPLSYTPPTWNEAARIHGAGGNPFLNMPPQVRTLHPEYAAATKPKAITTVGPGGEPVTEFVNPVEGSSYPQPSEKTEKAKNYAYWKSQPENKGKSLKEYDDYLENLAQGKKEDEYVDEKGNTLGRWPQNVRPGEPSGPPKGSQTSQSWSRKETVETRKSTDSFNKTLKEFEMSRQTEADKRKVEDELNKRHEKIKDYAIKESKQPGKSGYNWGNIVERSVKYFDDQAQSGKSVSEVQALQYGIKQWEQEEYMRTYEPGYESGASRRASMRQRGFIPGTPQVKPQVAAPKPATVGTSVQLSAEKAKEYLQKAGGDKDKARKLAADDGWKF